MLYEYLKMERILAKLVALSKDLTADQSLELVFDGRTEHLTFYKVTTSIMLSLVFVLFA